MVDYFEHEKLMQNINKPEGDNEDNDKLEEIESKHSDFLKDMFSKLTGKK